MKILTWNINGVRASKVPLKKLFDDLDADVICLQETKVTRDQLDEKSAIVDGYNSYFSFSKARSGYSGVANFVRDSATPFKAEEGLSGLLATNDEESNIGHYGDQIGFSDEELESLDKEGRTILTQHRLMTDDGDEGLLTVINVYCPRADPEREERKSFKLRFYELLQIRAEAIAASGSHVIVLGDVNTSHQPIDNCDPGNEQEFRARPDRRWLDQFLAPNADVMNNMKGKEVSKASSGGHFVDTFRYFHPTQKEAYTCWSTVTGARATNYGTRIDYIMADIALTTSAMTDCIIMPEVEGSDHCPVKATLQWEFIAAKKCPPLCSKYLPEFTGRQQKLSAFLKFKRSSNTRNAGHDVSTLKHNISETDKEVPNIVEKSIGESFKRTNSDPETLTQPSKRTKLEKTSSSGKQSSLMAFFGKPKTENIKNKGTQDSILSSEFCVVPLHSVPNHQGQDINEKCEVVQGKTTENVQVKNINKAKPAATSSWKNLLSGPAPPPLCKGHSEPCVLRTVKKDSLNKGRQFYVCNRPDGAKNNPLARCDHFEWVEKKKKLASS